MQCSTRTSFRFLHFALLDDLVFEIIGGGKAVGGADSSGVGSIGVGSTHSSSSRSVEADGIVRDDKYTVVGLLLLCEMVAVGPAAALGVTDRRGRSHRCHFGRSPPRLRVRRGGRRRGRRLRMHRRRRLRNLPLHLPRASRRRGHRLPRLPDVSYTPSVSGLASPLARLRPHQSTLSLYRQEYRSHLPRDSTSIRGYRQRPTTTAAHRRSKRSFYSS